MSSVGPGGVADAPAGHGVGLRDAVHGQRARLQARLDLRRRRELEVAVDEMLVHIVGQHPHMRVAHQHVGELFQLALRVGRAGRVRRRVKDEPLGARRDRALQIRRLQFEPVVDRGRHNDRRSPVDRHHLRIAYPIGRGDDDLVALVHGDEEGVVEDLLSPGRDDRVRGLVVETVLTAKLGRDRLAQRRNAEHGRVLGLAALDRLDRRLLDVVGRVEIRLADRKRDHFPSFGFEVARLLRHRDGRGWLNAREDVGEEGHLGTGAFRLR